MSEITLIHKPINPKLSPVLAELKRTFQIEYKDRLAKMVLFGSQARNEAVNGSDIDILIVLKGNIRASDEILKTGGIVAELSLKYDQMISCLFMEESRFLHHNNMLLRNIRLEGITL